MEPSRFAIRFWGVRGSLPTPGPGTVRYGGNTACLEILAGDDIVIVDCGTGAQGLGADLLARNIRRADLLFTHSHLDHVLGFPFFRPAYDETFTLTCWYPRFSQRAPLDQSLRFLLDEALWPLGPTAAEKCRYSPFTPGESFELEKGVAVRSQLLNHPGGAVGYRIEYNGNAIAIITDHEHGDRDVDAAVTSFVGGADIMVYDAAYTEAEYEHHHGWGHSSWEQALALAERAGVATPVLFHHLPERDDKAIERLLDDARRRCPEAVAAQEGLVLAVR